METKENTWEKLSVRSMCELVYAVKEQPTSDKEKLQIAVALTPDNVKHIAHCVHRAGSWQRPDPG
jgi:hypothetical protein